MRKRPPRRHSAAAGVVAAVQSACHVSSSCLQPPRRSRSPLPRTVRLWRPGFLASRRNSRGSSRRAVHVCRGGGRKGRGQRPDARGDRSVVVLEREEFPPRGPGLGRPDELGRSAAVAASVWLPRDTESVGTAAATAGSRSPDATRSASTSGPTGCTQRLSVTRSGGPPGIGFFETGKKRSLCPEPKPGGLGVSSLPSCWPPARTCSPPASASRRCSRASARVGIRPGDRTPACRRERPPTGRRRPRPWYATTSAQKRRSCAAPLGKSWPRLGVSTITRMPPARVTQRSP